MEHCMSHDRDMFIGRDMKQKDKAFSYLPLARKETSMLDNSYHLFFEVWSNPHDLKHKARRDF